MWKHVHTTAHLHIKSSSLCCCSCSWSRCYHCYPIAYCIIFPALILCDLQIPWEASPSSVDWPQASLCQSSSPHSSVFDEITACLVCLKLCVGTFRPVTSELLITTSSRLNWVLCILLLLFHGSMLLCFDVLNHVLTIRIHIIFLPNS